MMEKWKTISFPSKLTPKELQVHYSHWHAQYDNDMDEELSDVGPKVAADILGLFVPAEFRREIRVLDVCAGTGRVGRKLLDAGFDSVDAVDMNEDMLSVLKSKGIYQHILCSRIEAAKQGIFKKKKGEILVQELNDSSYDAVIIVHGFGQGHLPVEMLWEVHRILKPSESLFISSTPFIQSTVEDRFYQVFGREKMLIKLIF